LSEVSVPCIGVVPHPKYGGRKKGRQNKLPTEVKERFQRLLGQEISFTPLQVMHAVMLTKIEQGYYDGALVAAEKAAPYSHAKLNTTDVHVRHSISDKSDAAVAAEIEALRTKIERSRPAPPVMIEATAEPVET
jgi:hypothetical protein